MSEVLVPMARRAQDTTGIRDIDIDSVFSTRSNYTLSDKALAQRKMMGEKRSWIKNAGNLKYRLKLKEDETLLVDEILQSMSNVFSFEELMEIYTEQYEEKLHLELDECYESKFVDDPRVVALTCELEELKREAKSNAKEVDKLRKLCRMKDLQAVAALGPLGQAVEKSSSKSYAKKEYAAYVVDKHNRAKRIDCKTT